MNTAINATMAHRAVRAFPLLGAARVVRTWSGLRVMTTDGFNRGQYEFAVVGYALDFEDLAMPPRTTLGV